MTTIKESQLETRDTTVVTPVVDAPARATAVDVSAIPETPDELLKQWAPADKPLLHTVIATGLGNLWSHIAGPGMTAEQRIQREIAEHGRLADYVRKFL